jgi:hypothetical protein
MSAMDEDIDKQWGLYFEEQEREERMEESREVRESIRRTTKTGGSGVRLKQSMHPNNVPDHIRVKVYAMSAAARKGVSTACAWCMKQFVKGHPAATFCEGRCRTQFHNWRRHFSDQERLAEYGDRFVR